MLRCPKYHATIHGRYFHLLISSVYAYDRSFHTNTPRHNSKDGDQKSIKSGWSYLFKTERRRAIKLFNDTIKRTEKALIQQATSSSTIDEETIDGNIKGFDEFNPLTAKRIEIGSLLHTETLSILNQQDCKYLAKKYKRLSEDNLKNSLNDTRYDCSKLLYLLIHSKKSEKQNYHTMKQLIEILTNHLWFHNASVLILKMSLQLGDLLSFIDTLLEKNELLRESSWMKLLFLCKLSDVLKVANPRLISQISYLNYNHGYNLIKLRFMNSILHNLSNPRFTQENLDRTIKSFCDNELNGKPDFDIEVLQLYATIDLIKVRNQGSLEGQLLEFNDLLDSPHTREKISLGTNLVSSVLNHLIELRGYELTSHASNKNFDLVSFVLTRRQRVVRILNKVTNKYLSPAEFFFLTSSLDSRKLSLKIYKKYSTSPAYENQTSFYTPLIIENLGSHILNVPHFLFAEFGKLSRLKKVDALIAEYGLFEHNDNVNEEIARKHYGRFIYLLGTIKDKDEVRYVVQSILKYFYVNHNKYLMHPRKLLKMLLMPSNVGSLSYKRQQQIGNTLKLKVYDFLERDLTPIRTLRCWIEMLEDSKKISAPFFLPFLLCWMRSCYKFNYSFESYSIANRFSNLLNKFLISTINYSSPKNTDRQSMQYFASKIYLSNRELMKDVAIEFSKCDYRFKQFLFRKQLDSVAILNVDDDIDSFSRRITAVSIILELFTIMFLKGLPRIRIENSKFGLDPSLFFDIQEFLDSITLKYPDQSHMKDTTEPLNTSSVFPIRGDEITRVDILLNSFLDSKISSVENKSHNTVGYENSEISDIYSTMMNNFWDLNDVLGSSKTSKTISNTTGLSERTDGDVSTLSFNSSANDSLERGKRALTLEQKLCLLNMFCTLRIKSKMVEDIISRYPNMLFELLSYYYQIYNGDVPLTLIHSMILGIFKSNIAYNMKLELFKKLEKLGAMINGLNDSSLFHYYVRFKDVHIALVDLIIQHARECEKGSLMTLSWALKKFIRTPNVSQYDSSMKRWVQILKKMKDEHTGFWSNTCK